MALSLSSKGIRNIAASAMGVGAGLLGTPASVVGLAAGALLELAPVPGIAGDAVDGLFDGSVALVAQAVFAGSGISPRALATTIRPHAAGFQEPVDGDGLIG